MIKQMNPRELLCKILTGNEQTTYESIGAAEWEQIAILAQGEGLAPLIYWKMRKCDLPATWNESFRWDMAQAYYTTTAHNTLLFAELDKIRFALKQASILVMTLKGAALAPTVYPNIWLRPMADVDLLVRKEDLERAVVTIKALGYEYELQEQAPGLLELADYHVRLSGGASNRSVVELHWGLVASQSAWYSVPADWYWEHTQPLSSENDALILTPTAHLLYLTAHAMLQHGGSQVLLIWLYDLHLLVQSGMIDWDLLLEEAERLRWSGVVETALRLAQTAFATHMPEENLDRLRKQADPDITRLVAFKQQFGGVRLLYDWYSLLALRGRPQLNYALGMIFPQPDYIRWRYQPHPIWLWPVYYPYRWMRMLVEGWLAMRRGILRAAK
jgi:hypothetical protein